MPEIVTPSPGFIRPRIDWRRTIFFALIVGGVGAVLSMIVRQLGVAPESVTGHRVAFLRYWVLGIVMALGSPFLFRPALPVRSWPVHVAWGTIGTLAVTLVLYWKLIFP